MRLFLEVVQDLFKFAIGRDVKNVTQPMLASPEILVEPIKPVVPPPLTVPVSKPVSGLEPQEQLESRKVTTLSPVTTQSYQPLHVEQERMFITVPETQCFLRPVRAFDTVIAVFSYGEAVLVGRMEGRWASVTHGALSGWVLKDAVTPDRSLVFPQFTEGFVYEPRHPETVKVRTLIQDAFAAIGLLLPLQDVEYVSYRLRIDGRDIAWPAERPRIAGRWQQILKGVRGVHISISPATGAVMECLREDGTGSVWYVDAVHPDETIVVSGLDESIPGRFTSVTYTKIEWQALQPVFIALT